MDQPKQVVWVLGAGFSRSLGGPLLKDLLSRATIARTSEIYKTNRFIGRPDTSFAASDHNARLAAGTIRYLSQREDKLAPALRQWIDAEEFLDDLDAGAQDHGSGAEPSVAELRFRASAGVDDSTPMLLLSDSARRLVAAASCGFLREARITRERWDPYTSWAKLMTPRVTAEVYAEE